MQAEFVKAVFTSWDTYRNEIRLVNFVWMHEMSKTQVQGMTAYYGVSSPAFASIFGNTWITNQ